jgi:hypothetical protein
VAMNHVLAKIVGTDQFESFAIPLPAIMAKHTLLGGEPEPQYDPETHQAMAGSVEEHREESRQFKNFDTVIVEKRGEFTNDRTYECESRQFAYFDV